MSGNSALDDSSGDTGAGGGIGNINFDTGGPPPTLLINNSTVTDNAVSADGMGGGIANLAFGGALPGTVTINHNQVNLNNPDNCFPAGSVAGCIG